jgi:hypothetical protein
LILGNLFQATMMVYVPNRLMIFLFQTHFSATEAAKLPPTPVVHPQASSVHARQRQSKARGEGSKPEALANVGFGSESRLRSEIGPRSKSAPFAEIAEHLKNRHDHIHQIST